ncbi:SapB/AmfS family lanthipeptide [Streptomyces sp. NPDC045470]
MALLDLQVLPMRRFGRDDGDQLRDSTTSMAGCFSDFSILLCYP